MEIEAEPKCRLRGNTYISRTEARRVIQEVYGMLRTAVPAFYGLKLDKPGKLFAAKEAGIFDDVYFDETEIPEKVVDKVVRDSRRANNCTGHNLDASGRKRQPHRRQRKAGGGFSFKPEIPYRQAGNGEFYSGNGDDFENHGFRLKYDRKNHPPQSLPKIEWSVCRKWKNRYEPMFNTTEESRRIKKERAENRKEASDTLKRRKLNRSQKKQRKSFI